MKSNVELYVGMKNQSTEHLKFIMPLHKIWRRLRDSNPGDALTPAGFQDQCNRPLCQTSGRRSSSAPIAILKALSLKNRQLFRLQAFQKAR